MTFWHCSYLNLSIHHHSLTKFGKSLAVQIEELTPFPRHFVHWPSFRVHSFLHSILLLFVNSDVKCNWLKVLDESFHCLSKILFPPPHFSFTLYYHLVCSTYVDPEAFLSQNITYWCSFDCFIFFYYLVNAVLIFQEQNPGNATIDHLLLFCVRL